MAGISEGLFAGRSGIQSHGAAISVLADNIANSNTVGYKTSRADFADLLAGNISGSGGTKLQIGSGSEVSTTTPIFTQGAFELTGRGLDLAIDGNGFFVVENQGSRFYTRAGNFQVNDNGFVVSQNGFNVLGFASDGSGGLDALNINNFRQSNVSTTTVSVTGNLDATATTLPGGLGDIPDVPPLGVASFADLANGSQFSTFVDVFDSLGATHTVTFFFSHTGNNEWAVRAYVDAADVGGVAGQPALIGQSDPPADGLVFDNAGALTALPTITMTPTWSNQSAQGNIEVSFPNFTQFATGSGISSITQDGKGAGNVVSFNVNEQGQLFALFDNGQSSSIGTVALATFARPEGLARTGGSLFTESTTSGEPVIGRAASGQFGTISAGSLELSNADIANDFVKLISLQRGFQGSSRIITSIDDLLSEIINLAR